MGGKSGPRAPDPYRTANAQTLANAEAIRESARVNRFNVNSPYGGVTWDRNVTQTMPEMPEHLRSMGGSRGRLLREAWLRGDGSRPVSTESWTQNINLSPSQQRQLDQQNLVAEALGGIALDRSQQIPDLGTFNLEGIPELRTDFADQAGELERATYDRAQQLMAPGREQQQRRLETQLANQGLPIGGEAYATEMGNLRRSMNEADLAAALESVGRGRQEQSRLFGLTQAARQQGISDRLLERSQPINELAAILQGSPAIQSPQVPATAQYQQAPADISGLIQNNYQTQQQNRAAAMGGLSNLAGSGLMAYGMMNAPAAKAVAACIPEGQLIDTPDGPKPIEQLTAGDTVTGFDGKPVKVMMHHAYAENPDPVRFAKVTFTDGTEVNLCDMHKIHFIRAKHIEVGDRLPNKEVASIEWYNGVERSFDMLTEDAGYQVGGVPVNSMIEEMMRIAAHG